MSGYALAQTNDVHRNLVRSPQQWVKLAVIVGASYHDLAYMALRLHSSVTG
jgi:hypothetical protein